MCHHLGSNEVTKVRQLETRTEMMKCLILHMWTQTLSGLLKTNLSLPDLLSAEGHFYVGLFQRSWHLVMCVGQVWLSKWWEGASGI